MLVFFSLSTLQLIRPTIFWPARFWEFRYNSCLCSSREPAPLDRGLHERFSVLRSVSPLACPGVGHFPFPTWRATSQRKLGGSLSQAREALMRSRQARLWVSSFFWGQRPSWEQAALGHVRMAPLPLLLAEASRDFPTILTENLVQLLEVKLTKACKVWGPPPGSIPAETLTRRPDHAEPPVIHHSSPCCPGTDVCIWVSILVSPCISCLPSLRGSALPYFLPSFMDPRGLAEFPWSSCCCSDGLVTSGSLHGNQKLDPAHFF